MTTPTPDLPQAEVAIVEMTNAFRARNGRTTVKTSPALAAAARAFAAYLAGSGAFSHTADGREPSARVKAAGYQSCSVAENIARFRDRSGFETRQLAQKTVDGWIGSPVHRATLLTTGMTEMGIGIAKAGGAQQYTIVQLFAQPQARAVTLQIFNAAAEPVRYALGGKAHEIRPKFTMRHTACVAPVVRFDNQKDPSKEIQFQAVDGDLFTVKPAAGGGTIVERGKRGALTKQ